MSDPIAFVVMPFRTKTVDVGAGAPPSVNFDALWRNLYLPVLTELGYRPVRADKDLGSLIIDQMLQRLAVADLVVADVSLPNANVYYEIGVRHAARRTGCVLAGARWARPVFDVASLRRLEYTLTDGSCSMRKTARARAELRAGLAGLVGGDSPVHMSVRGFPDRPDPAYRAELEGLADALSGYRSDRAEIEVAAEETRRRALTEQLLDDYGTRPVVRDTVAVDLAILARDHVSPQRALTFLEGLPTPVRDLPAIIEQQQIVLGKMGELGRAAAKMQELIETVGPGSDRYGILGGRYKELARREKPGSPAWSRYLDRAIAAYENGMNEDLNDFYPSSNLPRLYRRRGRPGDADLAERVLPIVEAACRRALSRGIGTEWLPLTRIGVAVDRADGATALQLAEEIANGPVSGHPVRTTLADLRDSVELFVSPDKRLYDAIARMAALVSEGA